MNNPPPTYPSRLGSIAHSKWPSSPLLEPRRIRARLAVIGRRWAFRTFPSPGFRIRWSRRPGGGLDCWDDAAAVGHWGSADGAHPHRGVAAADWMLLGEVVAGIAAVEDLAVAVVAARGPVCLLRMQVD